MLASSQVSGAPDLSSFKNALSKPDSSETFLIEDEEADEDGGVLVHEEEFEHAKANAENEGGQIILEGMTEEGGIFDDNSEEEEEVTDELHSDRYNLVLVNRMIQLAIAAPLLDKDGRVLKAEHTQAESYLL